eukprot:1187867-Prorocentrum_minimum.AAC.2
MSGRDVTHYQSGGVHYQPRHRSPPPRRTWDGSPPAAHTGPAGTWCSPSGGLAARGGSGGGQEGVRRGSSRYLVQSQRWPRGKCGDKTDEKKPDSRMVANRGEVRSRRGEEGLVESALPASPSSQEG